MTAFSASDLDDATRLRLNDPGGMLDIVESSPAMWREGFASARAADLSVIQPAASVALCGMGGSGISGDVLAATAATRSDAPVFVVKGFDLPSWVDERSLVVCVSYSGATEEALACFDEAIVRGCAVLAVAEGGPLADRAHDESAPLIRPPQGGLMPRAAFPLLAASLLVAGERAGLIPDLAEEEEALLEAVDQGVAQWGSEVPSATNDAKSLAASLAGKHAQVWGQEGLLTVAAIRWKTQLNENAKMNASWNTLPEALHNEIVPLAEAQAFVVLRAEVERERIASSIDALAEYSPLEARALGTSDLAVLASAVLLGDFVSVYAACLLGVDPSPIDAIGRFKSLMR